MPPSPKHMTNSEPSSPSRRMGGLLPPILVLGLGLWIRVVDLGWGLPAVEEEALPMKKAFEMWGWADGHLRLDPQTAGWPALSFYLHLGLQHLQYAVGRLSGAYSNPLDFFVAYQLDPSVTVLWARSLGVLASLGVILVAIRLGRRFEQGPVALLPALLLATSPLFVEHSQMVTPDILLTLFSALALDRILEVGAHGRSRDYVWAGVFAGLGTAAKYTPLLLCAGLYLVHLSRRRKDGHSLSMLGLEDRRLGWAAIATVLAFCLTSPFTFADFEILRRDFSYQMLHMQRGHFGHSAQGPGYLYYLRSVLGPGMGWTAVVAGLAGLGLGIWKRQERWLHLVLASLPMALVLGSLSTRFDRYMLPLLLPLSLGVLGSLGWVAGLLQRRGFRGSRWVVAALALLLLLPTAQGAWRHHLQVERPSTQLLAAQWLESRPDAATLYFVTEYYGPQVDDDRRQEVQATPVFARLSPAQQKALLARPFLRFHRLPLYSTRVELGAFYYDLRFFLSHDYVITSGAVRNRYEARPERFPRQVQFYRDLDETCDLAARFTSSSEARGPEIRIYRITDRTREQLVRQRGRLRPGFTREWFSRVHRPHFLAFLERIGAQAIVKEDFARAALFYTSLFEVTAETDRSYVLERVAYAQLRAGWLDLAEESYRRLEVDPAYRAVAWANLGFVQESRGDQAGAMDFYRRSMEESGNETVRQWVEGRIRMLEP